MVKAKEKKSLEEVLAELHKSVGADSIGMYENMPVTAVEGIPTGSLLLDTALGPAKGYAKGRIVEIWAQEAVGKTSIALHAIANVQKAGGVAAFIDAEHALDMEYAKKIGIQTSSLVFSQPDNGEEAFKIIKTLCSNGVVDIIVVDSVAAIVPKAFLDDGGGGAGIGAHARLMSEELRSLVSLAAKSNTTVIFINQMRSKVGVMYGNPNTTTGGNALKFYASIRLELARGKNIEIDGNIIGHRVRCKVAKNKTGGMPHKQCEFDLIYGKGVYRTGEIFDLAVLLNLIEKSGAWYKMDGESIGQGRENACQYLEANPAVLADLEAKVTSLYVG